MWLLFLWRNNGILAFFKTRSMVSANLICLDSLNRFIVLCSYKALMDLCERMVVSTEPVDQTIIFMSSHFFNIGRGLLVEMQTVVSIIPNRLNTLINDGMRNLHGAFIRFKMRAIFFTYYTSRI